MKFRFSPVRLAYMVNASQWEFRLWEGTRKNNSELDLQSRNYWHCVNLSMMWPNEAQSCSMKFGMGNGMNVRQLGDQWNSSGMNKKSLIWGTMGQCSNELWKFNLWDIEQNQFLLPESLIAWKGVNWRKGERKTGIHVWIIGNWETLWREVILWWEWS